MKLSRAAGYGIHAVVFIARQKDGQPVLARTIAKEYKLPLESLLKILQQLVRGQLLRSTRGPAGGFRLGRAADKISLADIVAAADGPIAGEAGFEEEGGDPAVKKAVGKLCKKSARQVLEIFGAVKVSDLV